MPVPFYDHGERLEMCAERGLAGENKEVGGSVPKKVTRFELVLKKISVGLMKTNSGGSPRAGFEPPTLHSKTLNTTVCENTGMFFYTAAVLD